MPSPHIHLTRGRTIAAVAVAAVAVGGSLLSASTAGATTSTIVHITAVGPHLVPALTVNQVITVTGTGFDEAVITGVTVTGCTTVSYVVSSPTTMLVKTDASCTAGTGAVVTVTDTSSNTAVSVPGTTGGAQKLDFITAPSIVAGTAAIDAATTDNTATLAYASHGLTVSTKGGATIRVTSGANAFVTSTALPFSASLDGVALTAVKIVGATAGNYFTGVVGAHVADAAPVLKITMNGVSKTFAYAAPGVSTGHSLQYAGSTIAVSPAFGPANGGTLLTISGAGFSTTAGNDTVTIGGVSCPVSGTPTATSIKCTTAANTTPGPGTVQVAVTGGLTSVVSAGSTYTYLGQ